MKDIQQIVTTVSVPFDIICYVRALAMISHFIHGCYHLIEYIFQPEISHFEVYGLATFFYFITPPVLLF